VDVKRGIKCSWRKWKEATCVLCDTRIPMRLKDKFCRSIASHVTWFVVLSSRQENRAEYERYGNKNA